MVDLQSISYMAGALGVCIAAVYYMMTLRIGQKNQELSLKNQDMALQSQLQSAETRQAQLFMQVFNRFHDREFWNLYASVMQKDWKSYDDWYNERLDPSVWSMRLSLVCYFEGVGLLVSRGLLSPELVTDILGGTVVMYWDKQSEYIKEYRMRANYPQYCEYLEYLYEEIMKVRKSGFAPKWGEQV